MANQNPARNAKAKVASPPVDRAARVEELAEMVVAAAVLYREAEGAATEAVLLAAREMTTEELMTTNQSIAEATRPYSMAMIRRVINNPDVFGRAASTLGWSS